MNDYIFNETNNNIKMLYNNNRNGFYNSITQEMNNNITNNCVFWTVINSIIGCFVLYYCLLASYAIRVHRYMETECNTSLLCAFVCITIIVSIGLFVSNVFYRMKQTNIRFAFCIFFILSIIGVYGLIFMELTDKCAIENNYKNDLYSISWIWINLVSFGVFTLIISTFVYIAYKISYKEDTFKHYKYKKDDIIRLERERDLCDIHEL